MLLMMMKMKIMAIQANRQNLLSTLEPLSSSALLATWHVAIVAEWQQSQANKNHSRLFALCTNIHP